MLLRSLRMDVLAGHRRTGELLTQIKLLIGADVFALIQKHHMSQRDATLCIALFDQWEQVIAAVEWSHNQGWRAPSTPEEALSLLPHWKQAYQFN